MRDLQDAIDAAEAARAFAMADSAEVWVRISPKPYLPSVDLNHMSLPADPRDRTFVIPPGIQVRGGFRGPDPSTGYAGESSADERGIGNARFTVLSGDFMNTPNDPTDDSYTVVFVEETIDDRSCLLDYCTVVSGHADGAGSLGTGDEQVSGGGLYVWGTQMTVEAVTFFECSASQFGGGVSFRGQGDRRYGLGMSRCTFIGNSAGAGGGLSMRSVGNHDSMAFLDASWVYACTFTKNAALDDEGNPFIEEGRGGAVWIGGRDGRIDFADCVMDHNTATRQASAVYVGTEPGVPTPTPIKFHCSTVADNRVVGSSGYSGLNGAAIYYGNPAAGNTPIGRELIRNCIVWGNRDAGGGGMQIGPTGIVGSTSLDVEHSDVELGGTLPLPGPGNINQPPQFVSSTYYLISASSPCKDAGTDVSMLPADHPDLDDQPATTILPVDWRVRSLVTGSAFERVVNGNTDMGAFEVQ